MACGQLLRRDPTTRWPPSWRASAGRAQSRGGVAAAATFLERATVLTSDPALRGSRAIAAAQAKRDAAAPEAAYELLAIAELGPLSALQQAQVARMRAQMEFVRSRAGEPGAPTSSEAAAQLLSAARRTRGPRRRPGAGDVPRGAHRRHVRGSTRRARQARWRSPRPGARRSIGCRNWCGRSTFC